MKLKKKWLAGILASEIGYGGVEVVSNATSISRTTIIKGKKEVKSSKTSLSLDVRKKGGQLALEYAFGERN